MEVPAGADSGRPFLYAAGDGPLLLSWTEPVSDSLHTLRYAVWNGDGWSRPQAVAAGPDWFVNWADVPSVVAAADGGLAAHYLVKVAGGPYAYGVYATRASDGRTWSPAVQPHRDGTATEHGFVSLIPEPGGRTGIVWLDGRAMAGGHDAADAGHAGTMSLRYAALDAAGDLVDEAVLDERTCECCQTAAVPIPGGLFVAYRDRSEEEVRDIAYVRRLDGRWSAPQRLAHDGWAIQGCPVNGPAADARGRDVAVTWFTGEGDRPRVLVAFSVDGGATFGQPVRVDDGATLGRVDVAWAGRDGVVVTWLDQDGATGYVRARCVAPNGRRSPVATVAETAASRASGFPRVAVTGTTAVFAWTDVGEVTRVRTAAVALEAGRPFAGRCIIPAER